MIYGPDDWVGPHIRMRDIACKCGEDCGWKRLDSEKHKRSLLFFEHVGRMLDEYVGYVAINSGLRCPSHNLAVGGSGNSAHLHRVAVDLEPDNSIQRLWHMAEAANFFSGMIYYPSKHIIHLDIHPSNRVCRGLHGPKHIQRLGLRGGSGLYPVLEENADED